MANVLFSRTDSPSTKPITDGQIIFDTSGNGKMYLDNGTTRLEMGGAIEVDATLDATSTNPIQNKGVAGVMLGELEEIRGTTKKGFLTDALATKTLDAKITELNGKLKWTVICTGITLTDGYKWFNMDDYNEIYVVIQDDNNVYHPFIIPRNQIIDKPRDFGDDVPRFRCINGAIAIICNGGMSILCR